MNHSCDCWWTRLCTTHLLSMLGLACMVFAFDINKHVHFVTSSVSAMTSCEHKCTLTSVCFVLASKMAFIPVLVWVWMCKCERTEKICAAACLHCVFIFVCIFNIQNGACACGHAPVERSVSLTDRWEVRRVSPARSSFSPYLYHTHTDSLQVTLTARLIAPTLTHTHAHKHTLLCSH